MHAQVDRIHSVYFDELKPNGRVAGRSDDGKLVFVDGSEEILGKISDVRIVRASRGSLDGVLL
jgi:tRNA-2-methylthio-N6-dimethylallyladenosine synthase